MLSMSNDCESQHNVWEDDLLICARKKRLIHPGNAPFFFARVSSSYKALKSFVHSRRGWMSIRSFYLVSHSSGPESFFFIKFISHMRANLKVHLSSSTQEDPISRTLFKNHVNVMNKLICTKHVAHYE